MLGASGYFFFHSKLFNISWSVRRRNRSDLIKGHPLSFMMNCNCIIPKKVSTTFSIQLVATSAVIIQYQHQHYSLIAWDLSNGVNIEAKWVTKTMSYTKTNNVKLVAKKSQRGRLQQMFPLRLQLRCYYRSLRKLYFWLCQSWILRTSFSSLTLAGTSTISWIRYKNIIQVSINMTTYRHKFTFS